MTDKPVSRDLCDERHKAISRDLKELKLWGRITAASVLALALAVLSGDVGSVSKVVNAVAPAVLAWLHGVP